LQILFFVFLAIIVVQSIYLIIFWVAFSRKGQQPDTRSLPVSIIVCAHDEEKNLKTLIPLLLEQDYPEFEIIVVDDRSNDDTFDWLLNEAKNDHRLRMVHVNRLPLHVNGKKYAITLGIRAAKYEWLLFTDADCRPHGNTWIKSMSAGFTDDFKFVLGYSPYIKQAGLLNYFIRFESLMTGIQYLSFALLNNPYMGVGRNLAYRRSLFMEAKGFHDSINITGGDDDLFVNRHAKGGNTTVYLSAESQMSSIPQQTWGSFFHQKIRHLSVGKFYKFRHRLLLGLFSVTWMLTWFTGLPLLATSYNLYVVAGALLIRTLLFMTVVYQTSKKLEQPFMVAGVLPLDFIYAFYYLVTGLVALVSKKVRWKN
jgi:glycosyltransferase involved in cell wall biosynthesis